MIGTCSGRFMTAVACCFVAAAELRAQDDPAASAKRDAAIQDAVGDAETVLVTATRTGKSPLATPAQAFLLPGELALRRDLARSFADGLKWTPGVVAQKTSSGQTSPYLRGLTGYHTLLLLDGVRLNNSILRAGPNDAWSTIDPFSVGATELVLGPGAVLYGSDAVGGVASVASKRRLDYSEARDWDRRIVARAATGERSFAFRVENEGNFGEDFGFFVGATYQPNGRIDAGGEHGPQPNTGFENLGADAAFDMRLDDRWTMRVTSRTYDLSDAWRTHATSSGVSFQGTTVGTDRARVLDFRRDFAALALLGEDLGGFVDDARFQISYQAYDEREDRVQGNGARTFQGVDTETFGLSAQFTSRTELGVFTYGAEWYRDFVDSFRDDYDALGVFANSSVQGPVGDDAGYDLIGLYVQDDIPLGPSFDLILGARLTHAAAEAERVALNGASASVLGPPVDESWTDGVGSARFSWRAADGFAIYGGGSQGFRAPNLSDLTRLDIARSGELEEPELGLDPERFMTFELGVRKTRGDWSADVAYFYTVLDDVIIRRPTAVMVGPNAVVAKSNDGDGHVQGIDGAVGYRFSERWSARASAVWQDGRLDQYATSAPVISVEPLSRIAPLQGRVALRYESADGEFWIEPRATATSRADRLSSSDRRDVQRIPPGGTPGYVILSLHAGAKLTENATLFGGVDNILDKGYRVHGSGVQEPGFNAILGVEITF